MGNLCCRERSLDNSGNDMLENSKTLKEIIIHNYETLEIIHLIHHNNSKIYLLKNNIVRKQFSLPKDRVQFYNEIETYRILSDLPFILKPLYIDAKKGTVYLPYIDSKPIKNTQNKKTIDVYLSILKNKYGIWREGDYIWNNLLQNSKTGQIYLIDFGNIPWNSTVSNTKWHINTDKYPRINLTEV